MAKISEMPMFVLENMIEECMDIMVYHYLPKFLRLFSERVDIDQGHVGKIKNLGTFGELVMNLDVFTLFYIKR